MYKSNCHLQVKRALLNDGDALVQARQRVEDGGICNDGSHAWLNKKRELKMLGGTKQACDLNMHVGSSFKRQLTKIVQKCRQVRDALVHLRQKIRNNNAQFWSGSIWRKTYTAIERALLPTQRDCLAL